ncbi:RISC-loading complex subunit TARBP2-like isoform X1 [Polistes fuscatus]|uniref:RISC-loading complex subunit TARBP2-like isoform X1 n=2 Tax=Polistes fuscatus TaxID=30207 RepID=UPI001CAA2A8C|nr:RISC-loading complex subunit TARBP2-like isoform X1 [Polistes fuscatus]
MNKTPVSILQEMMVKKKMIPNYDLIHDGGGTHVNTFTYRVSCEGLTATGTGRNKKDAKHEAAKAMLEKIAAHRAYPQLPASPAQSPVRSPIPTVVPASPRIPPNEPFINAIGALQSVCGDNCLEEPKYISISDEGPPHAKIFTYQCILSMFKEIGVATTKKQAKHEAARKMLNRIKDLVVISYPELLNDDYDVVNSSSNASKISQKKVNLGLKISEYHLALKKFITLMEKEILTDLKLIKLDMDKSELPDDILKRLETILTPLAISYNVTSLVSNVSDNFIVCIDLDTSPSIVQCGMGKSKEEATFKAIAEIIDCLIILLE